MFKIFTISRVNWPTNPTIYVALMAAWVATLGSLYLSEVAGYIPCTFCWYQRICMYPLAIILPVSLLRRDPHLPYLVLPFSLIGFCISIYHYLLQKTDWVGGATTCAVGSPCTTIWINWWGFVTIPFLAMLGFLLITLMVLFVATAGEFDDETLEEEEVEVEGEGEDRPWLPVIGAILLVVAAFALLRVFDQDHQGEVSQEQTAANPSFAALSVDSSSAAEMSIDGEQLYQNSCAVCHGQTGEGIVGLGNALRNSVRFAATDDNDLLSLIRTGISADAADNQSGLTMPPSGGNPALTDAELLAIIAYIRTK